MLEELDLEEAKDNEIVDLAWDENEDHLIVAFDNGGMAMLDFDGFDEGKSNWKFLYEL